MWNEQQAVEFAEASAATAFDQRAAHPDHADAIGTYFDNLRDTLAEYGVKGEVANIAEAAFRAKASELFGPERKAGRVMGASPTFPTSSIRAAVAELRDNWMMLSTSPRFQSITDHFNDCNVMAWCGDSKDGDLDPRVWSGVLPSEMVS